MYSQFRYTVSVFISNYTMAKKKNGDIFIAAWKLCAFSFFFSLREKRNELSFLHCTEKRQKHENFEDINETDFNHNLCISLITSNLNLLPWQEMPKIRDIFMSYGKKMVMRDRSVNFNHGKFFNDIVETHQVHTL